MVERGLQRRAAAQRIADQVRLLDAEFVEQPGRSRVGRR
jgi:hypothetical protein